MRLLCGESAATCLGMETKHHSFFIGCSQILHHFCPHFPCCTKLRHFFKQIIVCIEKERESFSKNIYIQPFFQGCFYISLSVAKCESNFLHRSTTSFTNMIPGNRNGIPFRKFVAAPFKNISNDAHRRFWWINVSSSCGVFF